MSDRCPNCGVPGCQSPDVCTGPLPAEAWRDNPAEYNRLAAELSGCNPHDAAVIRNHHHEGHTE